MNLNITEPERNTVIQYLQSSISELREIVEIIEKEADPKKANALAILRTIIENLEKTPNDKLDLLQGELFPLFRPQKSVELKREFALNFGGLEKIEKDYKHLLNEKLTSGLTLQQHIDKVKDWFNSLHGKNLGNWIKLFAYVKGVKEYSKTVEELVNFREISPGRYCFSIKQDKKFFEYFIRPSKKTGQFETKTRTKFLKWLYDNQNTIEFPMIHKGQVWAIPIRVYEYAENVSTKEILFIIDTSILESEFKEYIGIDIDEIDFINDLWEGIADQNDNFKTYRLNSFIDTPLKFLLTLKQIYSREGSFKTDSGYIGNAQTLTKENLNKHMGNLGERIKKHLQSRGKAGQKKSNITATITALILDTIWEIALERKWLMSKPKIESGVWHLNINPGYFGAHKNLCVKGKIS
jgi:hypothetical protein